MAERGLVVFPGPQRSPRRGLSGYAPFLLTVLVGAAIVVAVALVR